MSHERHLAKLRSLVGEPTCRCLIQASGESPCHLVGGFLRDRLLELPGRDIDAVVGGGVGRRVARRLAELLPARLVELGRGDFAAYRLVGSGPVVDLWDRREMSVDDDLRRRDFTVNSIALDLDLQRLIDPCDGLGDLERRVLRTSTTESFLDDPLRVLRLPRMAALLTDFEVDTATLEAARDARHRLPEVAPERIRDELKLLFGQAGFRRGFAVLDRLELFLELRPEAAESRAGTVDRDPLFGRLEELRDELARLPGFGTGEPGGVDLATARWVLFFGGPADSTAAARIRRCQARGYLSRAERDRVLRFTEIPDLPTDRLERRRFLHRFGTDWPTSAVVAGTHLATSAWQLQVAELNDLARLEGPALFAPPRLVAGEDVAQVLGLLPGPEIGLVLSEIERLQVDGVLVSRDQALAWLETRARPADGS